MFFDATLHWLRARLGRKSDGPFNPASVEADRAYRARYLKHAFKSTREFARVFHELWINLEGFLRSRQGEIETGKSCGYADRIVALKRDMRILAKKARNAGLINADDEAALVGDDPKIAKAILVRLYGGPKPNEPRPVDLAGPPISDARREGGTTTVVFISWTGAGTREHARAADWARALRAAGFAVFDHPVFAGYDWILADIARSDAIVAIVSPSAETWAAIEWESAGRGWDAWQGLRGSWEPAPVFAWFVEPSPRRTHLLERANRLPDDFDAAVAYVIRALRSLSEEPGP